jgi:hypothetical protein
MFEMENEKPTVQQSGREKTKRKKLKRKQARFGLMSMVGAVSQADASQR